MEITYTNSRGDSLSFGPPSFRVTSIGGLGDVESDFQTQKAPYQDGSTYIDSVLEERVIPIELKVLAYDESDLSEKRKYLSKVFNPKNGLGEFKVEIGDVVHLVKAGSDFVPQFGTGSDNMGNTFHVCQIQLTAPNPYWQTETIEEEPTFESLFSFPFEGSFEMGIQRDKRTIDNDGDSPTPIQIEFHGPAVNPIVINNTTGEFIKVNQTLGEGEIMKIDTTPGQKSVCFVDEHGEVRNVFNWIDLESEFFQLQIGENEIEYSADSNIQGAIFNIYYSKQYVGV